MRSSWYLFLGRNEHRDNATELLTHLMEPEKLLLCENIVSALATYFPEHSELHMKRLVVTWVGD